MSGFRVGLGAFSSRRRTARFGLALSLALFLALNDAPALLLAQSPTEAPTATPTPSQTPTQTPTSTVVGAPTSTPVPTATPFLVQVATATPAASPTPGRTVPTPVQPSTPISGSIQARITYPPFGQIVNLQPFLVVFDITGIRLNAAAIGTPSRPAEGHWVLLIDNVPVASGDALQIYVGGLLDGFHTVTVQVRNNDRSPLTPPVENSSIVNIGGVEVPPSTEGTPGLPEVPGGLPRTGGFARSAEAGGRLLLALAAIGAGTWLRRR